MPKKNYLAVSLPLAREIFKANWYVPVIAFMLFFFSGILPVISTFGGTPEVEWYISSCLSNKNIFFLNIIFFTPVIAGVMMMNFLHRGAKALMLHAQPMSKSRIFNTYWLSGWLMSIIPVVVTSFIYVIVMIKVPLFGMDQVLQWAATSCASITFYYGLTVLMGTFTGTTLMNLLCVAVMIIIIPLLMLITVYYCEAFMLGYYTIPEVLVDFAFASGPLWNVVLNGEELTKSECLLYFALGILFIIGAHIVYQTRKLERVGMATLSKTFEELMTVLVVFVGSSIFGLIATALEMSAFLIVMSTLIGLAVCIISVKIVVNKSVKIFNRDFVKSLILCLVCVMVFVSVTVFDVTGFGKRVPAVEDVKSVEIEINGTFLNYYFGNAKENNFSYTTALKSEIPIKDTLKLHQYILDNKLYGDDVKLQSSSATVGAADGTTAQVGNEYILIKYNLISGAKIERYYEIRLNDEVAGMLDDIMASDEFHNSVRLANNINFENISYIRLEKTAMNDDKTQTEEYKFINDKDVINGLIDAWDKDVVTFGYAKNNKKESINHSRLVNVEIFFTDEDEHVSFYVTDLDKNTVEYLTKQGYGQWIRK